MKNPKWSVLFAGKKSLVRLNWVDLNHKKLPTSPPPPLLKLTLIHLFPLLSQFSLNGNNRFFWMMNIYWNIFSLDYHIFRLYCNILGWIIMFLDFILHLVVGRLTWETGFFHCSFSKKHVCLKLYESKWTDAIASQVCSMTKLVLLLILSKLFYVV